MGPIDWRELYAQNQAAIANAGIRLPSTTLAWLPETSVPRGRDTAHRHFPNTPRGRGAVENPRRHRPAARSTLGRRERPAGRSLVHVPSGLDTSVPAPVVCMLHGCTQDPATFAAATAMNKAADRHGFVVVYPAQLRARNVLGCWHWFLPEHQQRGTGEPELISGIVRRLIATESGQTIDAARIFVAGLSSGGAMALILAVCYPDLFAAVAVHSGLPYRSADSVASALAKMGRAGATWAPDGHELHAAMGEHTRPVPSLVIQGTADRIVAPENARQILAQSMHANHLAAPQTCAHDPDKPTVSRHARADGGLFYTHSQWTDAHGALMHESIEVQGLGHAWSGGVPGGSYTDPRGPSATDAIRAFFAQAGRERTRTAARGARSPRA
jgi:poly(hydroxyalkanoate) depolymerase family esterase